MSLDPISLRVASHATAPEDAVKAGRARRVLPLLRRKHLLLCTLLIANAAAMEALPIFLDNLVGSIAAVLISVSAVLIFGEIVPQAIFLKYALPIGAVLSPGIWMLIVALSPLGWPLSKVIDAILGDGTHGTMYRRHELKELIGMHAGDAMIDDDDGDAGSAAQRRVAGMRAEIGRLQRLGLRQQYHAEDTEDGSADESVPTAVPSSFVGSAGTANGHMSSSSSSTSGNERRRRRRSTGHASSGGARGARSSTSSATARNGTHGEHVQRAAITADEARIIRSVLDMNSKLARDVMTPLSKLDALDADTRLDALTLRELRRQARQYFPVRRRRAGSSGGGGGGVTFAAAAAVGEGGASGIAGVLLATSLVGLTPSDSATLVEELLLPLTTLPDNTPVCAWLICASVSLIACTVQLYDALKLLRRDGQARMALVCDRYDNSKAIGILALDDILNTMLHVDDNDPPPVLDADVPDTPITLRKQHTPGYRANRRALRFDGLLGE
jgi:CBS domain containing-hemolysin-like protein